MSPKALSWATIGTMRELRSRRRPNAVSFIPSGPKSSSWKMSRSARLRPSSRRMISPSSSVPPQWAVTHAGAGNGNEVERADGFDHRIEVSHQLGFDREEDLGRARRMGQQVEDGHPALSLPSNSGMTSATFVVKARSPRSIKRQHDHISERLGHRQDVEDTVTPAGPVVRPIGKPDRLLKADDAMACHDDGTAVVAVGLDIGAYGGGQAVQPVHIEAGNFTACAGPRRT